MKKITQNLTKSIWCSGLLAIAFLFSLTINSQEVGQEYLANPGINTTAVDPDTGYDAAGTFNNGGNGNYGGWGSGTGGAYASATTNNGDCHSPDRMFRLFKTGGTDGQFIHQTITALPAGNYNFGFWNKWDATSSSGEALPTWSADDDTTPKFTIKVQNAEGAWVTVHTHVPAEPTADMTWTEETGTWTNDETRDVRVMFYKNGGTGAAPTNLNNLWYIDTATLNFASALAATSSLEWQGLLDFSLPSKYFRGFHFKATADIADLSIYSMETYSSGDRLTANNVYTLSGSASAGDDILFWMSNADDAANIYMNASNIFDVVVEESGWSGYNGDDPLTFSMNGTVLETYGELGVDGSGLAWEYTDTWAYKVDGAWTYGDVNCTDGSYYMWDSGEVIDGVRGCVYPLAVDQQATGASTDLVTAFSHDFHTMSQAGLWYNDAEAPIERVTTLPWDNTGNTTDNDALKYTDDGTFAYSNMQIQFTSKVDMSSMNTYTVDVYVDGSSLTGTAPVNLALKLQDSSEGTPWTNQNVIIQDITADTWTTLTFTFNDDASMSRDDVDRIVVQFNGEGNNDPVVAYMRNMVGSYTEPVATVYTDVTFNVDASGITVGANGMYVGGGFLGGANAHAMSDADEDGVWSVTIPIETGSAAGNYTFINSPNDANDYAGKENIVGQACADGQYSDRLLAGPIPAEAFTLNHCYSNCETNESGFCSVEVVNYNVTFEVDANNIITKDKGMYLGGGIMGGADAHAMSDEDGDGVWSVTLELAEGTTGAYVFLNGPGDGGDYNTKENLEGQECGVGQYNDRFLDPITSDSTISFCFATCEAACTPVTRYDVTFNVDTSGITVGESGIFLGGGIFGGSNSIAMSDEDADGVYTKVVSVPEGTTGHYAFFNGPTTHYDWGTKEDLTDLDCADVNNYWDRPIGPINADTEISYTYGTCDSPAGPPAGDSCAHTFVMNDSYGDGWNGALVDIVVGGVTVASDVTHASAGTFGTPSTENFTFSATIGETIEIVWTSVGTYASEISWSVLDGNDGTEIGSGSVPSVGTDSAGTANCYVPPSCEHTFVMNDSYGDGWNGALVDIIVGGVTVASDVTHASAGTFGTPSTENFTFSATEGETIELNWTSIGTYASEISWSVLDGDAGLEIGSGSVPTVGTVSVGTANCTPAACVAPTDLTVSDISTSGAIVSWVSDGSQFMIEIQPAGSPQGTEGGYTIGDIDPYPLTSVDLTGYLADNTAYDIYVINVCDGASSTWSGPVSFTTLPLPIVPDYTNDFSEYPGDLWFEADGAYADGPDSSGVSSWVADGFSNDGSTGAARINIYSTFPQEWLITPEFDLSGASWYLNVDASATEYASTADAVWADDDFVAIMVTTDQGATWSELYRWDAANSVGAAGTTVSLDLAGYSNAQFGFYAESTVSNEDIDFFIDNFNIGATALGVDDIEALQFSLFPNPVNNILTIKAQASIDSITVYNMLGQTVVTSTPNTNNSTIDMSALQTGAYFVQVSINNTLKTVRVVKN